MLFSNRNSFCQQVFHIKVLLFLIRSYRIIFKMYSIFFVLFVSYQSVLSLELIYEPAPDSVISTHSLPENSNGRTIRFRSCGEDFYRRVSRVCFGVYYDPEVGKRSLIGMNSFLNRHHMQGLSLYHRHLRSNRNSGILDLCCNRPCSDDEIGMVCGNTSENKEVPVIPS